MQRNTLATLQASVLGLALAAPIGAQAALTEDNFYIKNAADLVEVCSVSPADPLAREAIHFCHGFVSGAWQYHQSVNSGPKSAKLVCPGEPTPTRAEAVAMFVTWAKAPEHAQYLTEPAVDVMFRFLIEKWPCAGAPAGKSEKKR
jgi:hypothetical protein